MGYIQTVKRFSGVLFGAMLRGLGAGALATWVAAAFDPSLFDGESGPDWGRIIILSVVLASVCLDLRAFWSKRQRGADSPPWVALRLCCTVLGVGVLAVMLLDAPHRPRANARRSSCQSNLKQIMLGLREYMQDYNGRFPLAHTAILPPTEPPSSGWVGSLQPYLKRFEIFQCPSEANKIVGKSDYAYNAKELAGESIRTFRHADNTVSLCEEDESLGSAATASGPLVINRHLEGSNYAFVDGHVKWLQSDKAPTGSNVVATGTNFTFGN